MRGITFSIEVQVLTDVQHTIGIAYYKEKADDKLAI